jgi:hypothetical protein
MDESRKIDLQRIDEKLKDPNISPQRRQYLKDTQAVIHEQLKDKKTVAMRQHLIKAAKAGDTKEVEKVQKELQKSDKKKGFDVYRGTHDH